MQARRAVHGAALCYGRPGPAESASAAFASWRGLPTRFRLILLDDGAGDATAWGDVQALALRPLADGFLVLFTVTAGRSGTAATGDDASGWCPTKLLGHLQVRLQAGAQFGGVLLGQVGGPLNDTLLVVYSSNLRHTILGIDLDYKRVS